ncbi:hypothetical protein CRENBAI_026877 [Crenichthys baileyi]|uniref:Uncharacterized protein n=1 Tax=Crenichthys baileyi TaxID=28760 RepID=A0AAV9RHD9_9TELE
MEPDSVPGELDSLQGGLSLLDPLVDRILGDSVSQQQGWLRVYGKENSPRGRRGGNTSSGGQRGGGWYRDKPRVTGPDLSSKVRNRSSRTSWRFDPETGLWLSSHDRISKNRPSLSQCVPELQDPVSTDSKVHETKHLRTHLLKVVQSRSPRTTLNPEPPHLGQKRTPELTEVQGRLALTR